MSRTYSVIPGLLILLLYTTPSLADQAHLLIGSWTVDLSKLNIPNPPKSVTIVLSAVGGDQYKMSVDIVDNDGGKRHGASTFKADGTPAPAVGNADYDVVSMTMPSRRIMVMGGGLKGHPSNTRVFSLSDDGKHMVETVVGHGSDGMPTTRVDVWNRK
jgi:hypothetical protein